MAKPLQVCKDIYMIGGSGLSHPNDCSVYIVDAEELVMIDSGAGESFQQLENNIQSLGLSPEKLTTIIATHRHIDHIGSLNFFQTKYGAKIIAHELDAESIETGIGTGSYMYEVPYEPCTVDIRIEQKHESFHLGSYEFKTIHIPGHTAGSIAVSLEFDGQTILFGQDIHGPYIPQWGGDPPTARVSLQELIDLQADILCEGHFGIYQPADKVESYIQGYMTNL